MSGRIALAIAGLLIAASSVLAEEHTPAAMISGRFFEFSPATTALIYGTDEPSQGPSCDRYRPRQRPWPLPLLYASSAFLHSYDAFLTLGALKAGAAEANPLMKPFVTRSPVAFVAVKAGVAAASIMSAEHLWKQRHRKSAVVVMVLSNAMMVGVAAHNTAVVQQMK